MATSNLYFPLPWPSVPWNVSKSGANILWECRNNCLLTDQDIFSSQVNCPCVCTEGNKILWIFCTWLRWHELCRSTNTFQLAYLENIFIQNELKSFRSYWKTAAFMIFNTSIFWSPFQLKIARPQFSCCILLPVNGWKCVHVFDFLTHTATFNKNWSQIYLLSVLNWKTLGLL